MAHAWLDSLSEDWVSQPRSESSFAAQTQSQSQSNLRQSLSAQNIFNNKPSASRLPRLSNAGSVRAHTVSFGNSSNILSERSLSDRNIPESYRASPRSTLEEGDPPTRKYLRRSVSASTTSSVVHNTVHQKPPTESTGKNKGQTPEWKRRLIHGDLAYGEQRDLFSSAATGLENIFKPPPPAKSAPIMEEEDPAEPEEPEEAEWADEVQGREFETTIPSSPPAHLYRDNETVDIHVDSSVSFGASEEISQHLPGEERRKPPRKVTYKLTDETTPDPSGLADSPYQSQEGSQPGNLDSVYPHGSGSGALSGRSLSQASLPAANLRKVSNGSVLRNEEFSPILLSRHSGEDGKASFTPIELPPTELRKRLEMLRRNQMILADTTNNPDDGGTTAGGKSLFNVENTADYEKLGGHINFRRGGRSAEGSFLHRLLSPELSTNTSEMFPEESLQASTPKQFPSVRKDKSPNWNDSPPLPRVPDPSPVKGMKEAPGTPPSQAQARAKGSSGSPLKLFGPYDTFTNQTLMRRISQFEDQMTDGSRSPSRPADPSHSELKPNGSATRTQTQTGGQRDTSAMFGAGELDGYEFDDSFAHRSPDTSVFGVHASGGSELGDESLQSTRRYSLDRTHDSSPPEEQELVVNRRRKKSVTGASGKPPVKLEQGVRLDDGQQEATTPDRRQSGSESKRPRTSPSKDPTPKRRRTLHKSDISYVEDGQEALQSVQSSHQTMQSVIGRKRRDARDGDVQQPADPDILALRQILRPRTPTPSQRSSIQRERNPFAEAEEEANESEVETKSHQLRVSARASPLRPGAAAVEQDRKPSIKTEDFINEANKIMAMIRGKSGLRSGLASVEESEAENNVEPGSGVDDSFQESTREPFSRPPSREGRPLPRASVRQEDPELAEHLRKYEEQSDMGDLIGSSVRSLGLAQDVIRVLKEAEQQLQESVARSTARVSLDTDEIVSDPPNLRISQNPNRRHGESSADAGTSSRSRDEFPTQGSASSSGNSTGRSIPTGSSRGSDTRKTIAPQVVSHLIPDQVGNMVLDRERNIWVKNRGESPPKPQKKSTVKSNTSHMLPSEASEDDPFADIPDLTVDMTRELQNLRIHTIQTGITSPRAPPNDVSTSNAPLAKPTPSQEPAPQSSHSRRTPARGQTHQQSQETPTRSASRMMREFVETPDDAVEHEITLNDGRSTYSHSSKKRNLTISFSSPIASIIQDVVANSMDSSQEDSGLFDFSVSNMSRDSTRRGRYRVTSSSSSSLGGGNKTSAPAAARSKSRSKSRGPSRHLSVRVGQRFVPRPVSRIDEQDERDEQDAQDAQDARDALEAPAVQRKPARHEPPGQDSALTTPKEEDCEEDSGKSTDQDHHLSMLNENTSIMVNHMPGEKRQASLSFVVATPAGRRPTTQQDAAALLSQYVGTLSLSPLSDFTAHHGERSAVLEASYIVENERLVTGDGSRRVLSQSLQDLVARLAEAEPFEPYWEDMTELELSDKRLSSLHKLDEFCGKLTRLCVSKNSITNLGGIPSPVRWLEVSHNQLSELTAWGALMNLQYLDVSNNDIKTLSGISQLVHLRNLKADNCGLTSLDNIKRHDGLQMLRARGNRLEEVDFDGARMRCLVELDLMHSGIRKIANLEQLECLSKLVLDKNKLASFGLASGGLHSSLRELHLGDNELTTIDVSPFPQLRLLQADRNLLHKVRGMSSVPRLDSLSLREQGGARPLHKSFLVSACEVRKLFLSGNSLGSFEPPLDYLNLQLLELANCGLTSLPDMMGEMMPNLRKLNINFNAVRDISPLAHVPRLRKLSAAGNRLAETMEAVKVVETMPSLVELDLRDNPITQGFYAPAHFALRAGDGGGSGFSAHVEDDEAEKNVAAKAATAAAAALASAALGPFSLPPQDVERDAAYAGRLDMLTRMHRRLYEVVWVNSCDKLRLLDGLPLDRGVVAVRDSVWRELRRKGLVPVEENYDDHEDDDYDDDEGDNDGWAGEDSDVTVSASVTSATAAAVAATARTRAEVRAELEVRARAKIVESRRRCKVVSGCSTSESERHYAATRVPSSITTSATTPDMGGPAEEASLIERTTTGRRRVEEPLAVLDSAGARTPSREPLQRRSAASVRPSSSSSTSASNEETRSRGSRSSSSTIRVSSAVYEMLTRESMRTSSSFAPRPSVGAVSSYSASSAASAPRSSSSSSSSGGGGGEGQQQRQGQEGRRPSSRASSSSAATVTVSALAASNESRQSRETQISSVRGTSSSAATTRIGQTYHVSKPTSQSRDGERRRMPPRNWAPPSASDPTADDITVEVEKQKERSTPLVPERKDPLTWPAEDSFA